MSTIDGEVFKLEGLTQPEGDITWRRIATGLYQPLGIKYHNGAIYVGLQRSDRRYLRDLNGDGETDFYESFNSDHQVTEHFHEFAMGLQTDDEGNFYYAKSGRHARKSLVPQHGTLIKVSADGQEFRNTSQWISGCQWCTCSILTVRSLSRTRKGFGIQ